MTIQNIVKDAPPITYLYTDAELNWTAHGSCGLPPAAWPLVMWRGGSAHTGANKLTSISLVTREAWADIVQQMDGAGANVPADMLERYAAMGDAIAAMGATGGMLGVEMGAIGGGGGYLARPELAEAAHPAKSAASEIEVRQAVASVEWWEARRAAESAREAEAAREVEATGEINNNEGDE